MSEQSPLDLRGLADVDAPDVVRAALRTFRRRIVTRYVWMALLVVTLVAAAVWASTPTDLAGEVDNASLVVAPAGATWDVGGARVSLLEVAALDNTVGLHFVALAPAGATVTRAGVSVDGELGVQRPRDWETYVEVPRSSDGVLTARVHLSCEVGPCAPGQGSNVFEINLGALHVPVNIWEEQP
jgi:hypothetical protein